MNRFAMSYQNQQAGAWTRIDMLLALYDKTIEKLTELADAMESQLPSKEPVRIHCGQLLLGICQGLDMERGEQPQNIAMLCQYVNRCIWEDDAETIRRCAKCFATIREGFQAVRDDAAELERSGEIPSVVQDSAWERLV